MAYSFYTKKDDPFNFSYLNAAYNTQPKTTTPPPTTPPPTKTPPPAKIDTTPQPTDALKAVNQSRQAYYDQRAKDTETRTRQQQAIDASLAEEKKANLQNRYDQYAGQLDKSVAGQEQATAEQKQLLEDQTGEELRNQAQVAREGRGRLQNMFGALGAIDSSAFQNFAARGEDRLATGQAKSQQQLKFDKNASDRDLAMFKSGVEEKKMTELQKFYDAVDMIDANLQKGTLEYNKAVQDAYDKATDAMYAMDAEVAKMDAEYQNQARLAGLKPTELSPQQATAQTALSNIQELKKMFNENPKINQASKVPFLRMGYDWKTYEGLIESTADAIGRSRSGAAITPEEREAFKSKFMPTFLDSPEVAMGKLNRLEKEFGAVSTKGNYQASNGGFIVNAPDGQQIQIVD